MVKTDCVIFDLDGTIANAEHRLHFMNSKPKNYQAFHDACVDDTVYPYMYFLIRAVYEYSESPQVVICSGRPESHRTVTERWLNKYNIPYNLLMMRMTGDKRPDSIVKQEMLEKVRQNYNPVMAIDDRPSVVKMWRANGVPCLAVDDINWRSNPNENYARV